MVRIAPSVLPTAPFLAFFFPRIWSGSIPRSGTLVMRFAMYHFLLPSHKCAKVWPRRRVLSMRRKCQSQKDAQVWSTYLGQQSRPLAKPQKHTYIYVSQRPTVIQTHTYQSTYRISIVFPSTSYLLMLVLMSASKGACRLRSHGHENPVSVGARVRTGRHLAFFCFFCP